MATEKVGVYRKWHGPVSRDESGNPLPKREWIEKRPFSWAVRWFGSDGKRYSKSFNTRKEAERFGETKQQDVRQGKADPPARMTLREYYWEHKKLMQGKVADNTLHMQLATLALLAESVGWNRDLKRLNTRDIEQFSATRMLTGNEPITVNKEVKTLRRLFNLAISRGYLIAGTNPTAGVPLAKVGKKRKPYCSPEQFQMLFAKSLDVLWRALLVVFYTTGLRKKEAMHLTWGDIDFAAGVLHIARRDARGFVQKWTPKDHELRSIPLPKQAIDLLTTLQSVAPENSPYVFMDVERWDFYRRQIEAKKWNPRSDLVNNWLRRFKTLCKQTGVGRFTIHDLRRSCITNWARKLPIHVTQQLAGHSDIHTTQEYYLSVQADDLAKAKRMQTKLMVGLKDAPPTDPKLTHSVPKRSFPKRKEFSGVAQPPHLE
jgi:integrase